ncbi:MULTISPECIES: TetR/AcrR family transcriptional regulator [Streptomyces]|uniref:TetR/AcrR family transcriptional regulator n=1 Tax=Streptomyces TaxID=1883 RepID=UPI0004C7874C|nr:MULTISPECIES: TetR/AcrR family transcriptional regulator [Streptomyces]PPA39394.1 TetR family transcriptional regulator [Streptomyces griseus]RAN16778.1 TetR family transcriptional regulator [Streptomyces badius]AWL85596.1 TetR/AcrR family transcriptional regulator [Streptomyces globisporus]RAN24645.1 TetR family transcriptional regulator [Streptomyces badius]WSF75934.1 TetR/AcrR family transcriptional regulator [Streptomyces globisporus]
MPTTKTLREGSAQKRAAILTAARELFLADGFDRSSVDAVAARAEVSKRTVYDYFGDKRTLLRAVVDSVGDALVTTVRRTLDETLTDRTEAAQLEDALVAFSMRIATEMLGSAEYATLQRLLRSDSGRLEQQDYNPMANTPDEAIAERFAAFADAGLLDVPDPRLAADQFLALTFGVALDRLGSANAARDTRVRPLVVEGVRTFLRAYRADPGTSGGAA